MASRIIRFSCNIGNAKERVFSTHNMAGQDTHNMAGVDSFSTTHGQSVVTIRRVEKLTFEMALPEDGDDVRRNASEC